MSTEIGEIEESVGDFRHPDAGMVRVGNRWSRIFEGHSMVYATSRTDPVGDTAVEVLSLGGQTFKVYRNVKGWLSHEGVLTGETMVGGKPVLVYRLRKD